MGKLERIERTLFEIKSILQNSEIVRKLLYNDGKDALEVPAPDIKDVEGHIILEPVYSVKDFNKNVFLNIILNQCEAEDDNSIVGSFRINLCASKGVWTIKSGIRLIRLSDEIINLLDDSKFSVSDKTYFIRLTPLIIDETIYGYTLVFSFLDGVGIKEY